MNKSLTIPPANRGPQYQFVTDLLCTYYHVALRSLPKIKKKSYFLLLLSGLALIFDIYVLSKSNLDNRCVAK
jgi:hypothetical protein